MAQYDLGSYGAEIVLNSSGFEQSMSQAESQMNNVDKKANSFAGNLGKIAGGAILGLGAALVGAGVAGVKMADDLDKALNQLQSATGATEQEMKGMEQSLKNIYSANLGESFEDIANSMAVVKQNTGLAGTALENATKDALMLSKTFDMDVNESTRAAKAMMENFGITSDEAFNLMAQGAQNGANKNGDLIDTFNEYSPAMKALGFSAEEFTNILIDGAENGAFSIDKVGDAMKEFNIRAKDGSKASAEGFAILGLNAEEMTKKFAAGGESAQGAFQQVVSELSKIEDPVKKNAAAVALFGTMAEDLEIEAIEAFGNIGNQATLTKDAMEEISKINYSSFGEAMQGIGRNLNLALIEPMQKYVLPLLSEFANFIQSNMPQIQSIISTVFSGIGIVFSGLVTTITGFVEHVKTMFSGDGNIGNIFSNAFQTIQSVALPILQTVIDFIKTQLDTLKTFWQENGTQILEALTNVFNGIKAVIDFIMPAILLVISTVWNNIKGVISGALDIIMGAIKVFAGLFTGDFSKMWEGIKQLFSGAIEAVWNLINLMMFGKIIAGIKTFVTNGITHFSSLWTKVVEIFKNLDTQVWNVVSQFITKILGKFKGLYDDGARIFGTLKTFGETTFKAMWTAIKSVVDNIFTGVTSKFSSMATGAKNQFDGILSSAKSIFNSVKSAITNPIETAKTTVKNAVDAIKGFFSNMKVKIPMPHFNISSGTKNVAGINIPYPKISVDWYKNGGFFDSPQLIGIGEAGKEAVVPLVGRQMDPFADAVYQRLRNNLTSGGIPNSNTTNNQDFTIHNSITFNVSKKLTDKDMDEAAKYMSKKTNQQLKRLYGVR